jgi:UDP-N-acetyl-2-amino-2-deoxyglucuronate dehydrogenase
MNVRTIAVLGLGQVAEPHLLAYATLSGVKIIAVVDPRSERRDEICHRYALRGFASAEQMLETCRPDIVCILTPAQTHRTLTEICAAAGAHVLCEKPMALTLEDAKAMADACGRAAVQFFYGSSYRYLPAVREAKSLIAAGAIGAVRLVIEEMLGGDGADAYRALSPDHYPVGGPGGGGYGLVDHGIHMLDVFPWLSDSTISTVFGRGDRTGDAPRPELAVLDMRNGSTGVLVYDGSTRPATAPSAGVFSEARGWIEGRGWMGESGEWDSGAGNIRVYGAAGSLQVFHYANKLFVNRTGRPQEQRLPVGTAPYHFASQMQAFCLSLDRGEPPPTSARDGIRALRALLAIYDSEGRGRRQIVMDDSQP